MQISLAKESARSVLHGSVSNRQRVGRYERLVDQAQQKADAASCLSARRRYLVLILHLQERALRELDRGR